jgi:hypothetical protein
MGRWSATTIPSVGANDVTRSISSDERVAGPGRATSGIGLRARAHEPVASGARVIDPRHGTRERKVNSRASRLQKQLLWGGGHKIARIETALNEIDLVGKVRETAGFPRLFESTCACAKASLVHNKPFAVCHVNARTRTAFDHRAH